MTYLNSNLPFHNAKMHNNNLCGYVAYWKYIVMSTLLSTSSIQHKYIVL